MVVLTNPDPGPRPGAPKSYARGGFGAPRRWLRGDLRPVATWVLVVVLFLTYASLQPGILDIAQIGVICAGALPLAALSFGQGVVTLTGGTDLSVGGVLGLGTAIAATQFLDLSQTLVWIPVVLLVGALAGALNGWLVGFLGLQPFIVTLATWTIFTGIALLVLPTQGGAVPPEFSNLIYDSTAGIPNSVWALAILIVIGMWLQRTRLGRRIYAVGSDREGAETSGVRVPRVILVAYAIAGLASAAAALFYSMLTASGDPTAGDALILPSIAAVVLGGTSLKGGQGGYVGTVAGVLILSILGDVIFSFNLPSYWTILASGLLLLIAVVASRGLERVQSRGGAFA